MINLETNRNHHYNLFLVITWVSLMTFPRYGVDRDFNFFYKEYAIFILPASQVKRLNVSKILFCICSVLSPSVEKCG